MNIVYLANLYQKMKRNVRPSLMSQTEKINHLPAVRLLRLLAILVVAAMVLVGCTRGIQETANEGSKPANSAPPVTAFPMPPVKPLGSMGWELGGGRRNHFSDFKG